MASSRGSSPGAVATDSPVQLTPTSKINAMLAALDADSDEETIPISRKLDFASKGDTNNIDIAPSDNAAPRSNMAIEESEEDDDVILKPRNRLAARMTVEAHEGVEENAEEEDAARARVRRMLMAKAAEIEPEAESSSDDAPVVSKKRKLRTGRAPTATPAKSPPKGTEDYGGLFVSPASARSASPNGSVSGSEEELPIISKTNNRFLAMVAKKREERLALEAERMKEQEKKRVEQSKLLLIQDDDDEDDLAGGDVERQLTQQNKPTRKASKKAMEEMLRETQRMSRNMQLAHEARSRKKITKSSLFARFNYKPEGYQEETTVAADSQPSSSSPARSGNEIHDTPPTSPIGQSEKEVGLPLIRESVDAAFRIDQQQGVESGSFAAQQVPSSPPLRTWAEKGKGRAIDDEPELERRSPKAAINAKPPPKFKITKSAIEHLNDSDSDLEIISTKPAGTKRDSIFDRIPARQARESKSLHTLRLLAHVASPEKQRGKRNSKPSVSATEMAMSLQQRARQQAAREREERMRDLRARGIIVQSAEERQQEMLEVEDLIAKARREGEELAKGEKAAAKKLKAHGEAGSANENSSDDEDWEEEKEIFAEQLFGSEEDVAEFDDLSGEGEEEEEDDVQNADKDGEADLALSHGDKAREGLIDEEASGTSADDDEEEAIDEQEETSFVNDDGSEGEAEDEADNDVSANSRRRTKQHNVISDDEEEEVVGPSLRSPAANLTSPLAPHSVLRSATKTFIPGLTVVGPAGLSLTQIFAGTMDDSQFLPRGALRGAGVYSQGKSQLPDSLEFMERPSPALPAFEDDSQNVVRDSQSQLNQMPVSQTNNETQGILPSYSQSQVHEFDSLVDYTATTQSDYPEATQDEGFQNISPIKGRYAAPPSTMETVLLEGTPAPDSMPLSIPEQLLETPIPAQKKKGKLRKRTELAVLSDDEEQPVNDNNAFNIMRKAAKKKTLANDDFDKKKSEAKEMVHDQAEESEDEYAGLGGASDDESGGEEDAFVKEMIDDDGPNADERQLAAFYADKERANDEQHVKKLFNDLSNGLLRRKRGADYDLSDSDDDGEARRRMKQREFTKMRNALLADERIGKIAENPKKLAFLRAIEDRGERDDIDFLGDFEDSQDAAESQSQSQAQDEAADVDRIENSQPDELMGPPKRKASGNMDGQNRLPPHLRRTNGGKRPSNLSEVRESLSSLIDEPNSLASEVELDWDSGGEQEGDGEESRQRGKENRDPFASRRSSSASVVDRISLKRANSSKVSVTARLAFATSASASVFKVPALLRRATTNSSITSGSSASISGTERGGFGDDKGFVKKAGKNSGVNYFARENERQQKLQKGEKRREQRRFKGAEGRRKAAGALFGTGKFE